MTMTRPAWVEVTQEAGSLTLRLCGELDMNTCDLIQPAVMAAIPTTDTVVLDLGALTFCDSTGLSMFLAAQQSAEVEECTLILAGIPPHIARLMEITGVDRTLNIAD